MLPSLGKKSLPQCHATARESVNQHRQQKRVFKIFNVSMHDVYWYYGRFALLFKYCKGSNVKSKRIHFSRMRTAAAVVATRYQYQGDVWCNFLSGPMFLPGGTPPGGGWVSASRGSASPPVNRMTDRRLWKHYLPLRSITIGCSW